MQDDLKKVLLLAFSGLLISGMPVASLSACPQSEPSALRMEYVGIERDKPFSAEHVTQGVSRLTDGTEHYGELVERVARDSAGRIRFERGHHVLPSATGSQHVELSTADRKISITTREELGIVVMIFDHSRGQSIQLQPAMKIAWTRAIRQAAPGAAGDVPYSSFFSDGGRPSTEDLGVKEIQGISAHGFKQTQFGTQEDGEWNGKPIQEWERWVSDDLAATLLEIVRDLKTNKERRIELRNIKRQEPEASLFEIPAGFTINPSREQMPRIYGSGKPARQP